MGMGHAQFRVSQDFDAATRQVRVRVIFNREQIPEKQFWGYFSNEKFCEILFADRDTLCNISCILIQ